MPFVNFFSIWKTNSRFDIQNFRNLRFKLLQDMKSAYLDVSNKFHVFDAMLEGVQVVDSNWRYVYVNKTVVAHAKSTNEALLGKRMMDVFPGIDETPMFSQLETCMKARVGSKLLNQFDFPDGSVGYFELIMTPIEEGVMIMSVDVTEQKRLELELKKLNEHLESRVKERTEELSRALESEKHLNKVAQNMAAIISHDFKTPLVAIRFNVDALVAMNSKEHARARLSIYDEIRLVINSMFETVDDYLTLDKIQKGLGSSEIVPIDLREFVETRLASLSVLLKSGQEFQFSSSGSSSFCFDRNILRSILTNLVSNAIKYSEGKVVIQSILSDDELRISVQDFGIGIPKDELNKVCDKYFRASNSTSFQGTGLGLNIVGKYVELFGGKIDVMSELGKGTTVTVYLPNQVN